MADIEVKVPQLSESISEATLLQWKKQPGAEVVADEILVEVETDKVVLDVPAPKSGVLAEIVAPSGASVTSGQVIARIIQGVAASRASPEEAPAAAPVASAVPPPAAAAPIVMPAAARVLEEAGVSGDAVAGTGRGGRITKADAVAAVQAASSAAAGGSQARGGGDAPQRAPTSPVAAPSPDLAAPIDPAALGTGRLEQRVPMSRLRQRVAERLVQSQSTAAILTTFNEVNMQPVIELRNRHKERFEKEHGVKLGFMSFFVKAAVHALKRFPIVNASIDGSDVVYHGYFDVGIAVGSPRGLVVPVLRDADVQTFSEIEKRIADFGRRAGEGKLTIEELTGGTFTISNGGVFGSMLSTPIINPPQSAILGVHATKDRPVAENGQVVIRPMNYLALSYDHRIIDGRDAVLFLVAIKDALEDPGRLLLEM